MTLLALLSLAQAADVLLDASGQIKSFFIATFPDDELDALQLELAQLSQLTTSDPVLITTGPSAQAVLSGRLNLRLRTGGFTAEMHQTVLAQALPPTSSSAQTGLTSDAGELIDLSWAVWQDEGITDEGGVTVIDGGLEVSGRTDRLLARLALPGVDISAGRQPVSFGNGMFFTPMDLVNPFTPATIDQEYKPGVDALRLDGYPGMSRLTAVAAYVGEPRIVWDGEEPAALTDPLESLALATYAQVTAGVTDLSVFLGEIRADHVIGAGVVSSVGAVGVYGEATVTMPTDDDTFARAVLGGTAMPAEWLRLSGEAYVQTLGAEDASGYLAQLGGDRYVQGELWAAGRYYVAVSAGVEVTPLVEGSLAVIANVVDPSALVVQGVSWSISDEADLLVGVIAGVGERPGGWGEVGSEFGLYPALGYLRVSGSVGGRAGKSRRMKGGQ